jgi:hypothetical protein
MFIKDGKGGTYYAEVDSKYRLKTYSVIEDEATWVNRVEGQMYSGYWSSSGITAASAGNYIIYLKNTHTSKYIVIVKIKHRCEDANGTISIWLDVSGTPGGTLTTLTPGNRNAGSNNTADCTYYYSTDITGLSGGRKVGSVYGKAGEEFVHAIPCSGYILPPNGTLAIKADNDTAKHYGGLAIMFRD